MNLLKKIGTIAAAGAIGLGILAGCSTMQNAKKVQNIEKSKIDIKTEIEKEAERYERLFVTVLNGEEVFLALDRNKDGYADIIGNYSQEPAKDHVYLGLKSIMEDRNNNHIFEENERSEKNEEYQAFSMRQKEGLLFLGKDTDGDNIINKE